MSTAATPVTLEQFSDRMRRAIEAQGSLVAGLTRHAGDPIQLEQELINRVADLLELADACSAWRGAQEAAVQTHREAKLGLAPAVR